MGLGNLKSTDVGGDCFTKVLNSDNIKELGNDFMACIRYSDSDKCDAVISQCPNTFKSKTDMFNFYKIMRYLPIPFPEAKQANPRITYQQLLVGSLSILGILMFSIILIAILRFYRSNK